MLTHYTAIPANPHGITHIKAYTAYRAGRGYVLTVCPITKEARPGYSVESVDLFGFRWGLYLVRPATRRGAKAERDGDAAAAEILARAVVQCCEANGLPLPEEVAANG